MPNTSTKKNTKDVKLTRRQAGFVRDVIDTKNPAEAARRNYNINGKGGKTGRSAYSIAYENMKKPVIVAILNKAGITTEWLTDQLQETITETDNDNAKLKGIEMGYKLHGELQKDNPGQAGTNINVYQQYSNMTDQELQGKLNDVLKGIKKLQSIDV